MNRPTSTIASSHPGRGPRRTDGREPPARVACAEPLSVASASLKTRRVLRTRGCCADLWARGCVSWQAACAGPGPACAEPGDAEVAMHRREALLDPGRRKHCRTCSRVRRRSGAADVGNRALCCASWTRSCDWARGGMPRRRCCVSSHCYSGSSPPDTRAVYVPRCGSSAGRRRKGWRIRRGKVLRQHGRREAPWPGGAGGEAPATRGEAVQRQRRRGCSCTPRLSLAWS